MLSKKSILFFILAGIVFTRCASMHVLTNYDKEVDFEKYKTFKFIAPKHKSKGKVKNPLFSKDVMREIRPAMEAKGFSETAKTQDADLGVHFYAFIKNRRDYIPSTYARGRWGRAWVASPGHMVKYREGTLVIDIVDMHKKELIWQGVGKGVLNPRNPTEKLVEAVEDILKKFPPQK